MKLITNPMLENYLKESKEIPLRTKGFSTVVDAADYEALSKTKWYLIKSAGKFPLKYAKMWKKGKTTGLHSILMNPPKGKVVDHIDGDGLNNRRSNLRICSTSENMMNRGKQLNNTSGFKGVFRERKKWRARIRVNGNAIYLGCFDDKLKAYEAYKKACIKYHGEYAKY